MVYSSINNLLKEEDTDELKKALNDLTPFELADTLSQKSTEEQIILFSLLEPAIASQTFDFLPPYVQRNLLHSMPAHQASLLLNTLSPDDRTTFLQELPDAVVDELIKQLPTKERTLALKLLGYPEGSVGRLMTPDYIAVKMDWTIEEVLDHIQSYGHDSETIDMIYVIDDQGKLLDDIKLKDFLFISRKAKVESIVTNQFVALSVDDPSEKAINIFKTYNRIALPVMDDDGILVGIVTIDDILRLANQEATEDIQKIGGMEALNVPYLQAPFLELMRKRSGWLIILFLGEMFTTAAMGFFEGEIAKAVVLALFLPLIISSGGNAGSQASTLVVRAIALGEIQLKDGWKIIKRELFSGLFLGAILGVIGFFRVISWGYFTHAYGEHSFLIGITIGLSLMGVVMWGTLSGAIFPLILNKMGIDPAISSAPFVATLVDVAGVIIYFLIAIAILTGTLL